MRRFAMLGRGGCVAIHLVQSKARGVVGFLQEIEPQYALLLDAVARVLYGGFTKGVYKFGFDVQVDDEDEHK